MNYHFWVTFCIYYFYSRLVSHVGQPPESTVTRAASAFHWTQYRRDSCGYLDKIFPFSQAAHCCACVAQRWENNHNGPFRPRFCFYFVKVCFSPFKVWHLWTFKTLSWRAKNPNKHLPRRIKGTHTTFQHIVCIGSEKKQIKRHHLPVNSGSHKHWALGRTASLALFRGNERKVSFFILFVWARHKPKGTCSAFAWRGQWLPGVFTSYEGLLATKYNSTLQCKRGLNTPV